MPKDNRRDDIENFAASAVTKDGILGNYIVIAEVMHDNGVALNFAVNDGLLPWTAIGMLKAVASMLDVASFEYVESPEEDEEP